MWKFAEPVVDKNEFSRPPKELKKTQRQTYEKEHNKKVRFHRTEKKNKNMDIVPLNIWSGDESLLEFLWW